MTAGSRVSLVLGAGGARGYAHIGAIQVLLERGYEIGAVTGSSMSALISGIFAAGQLEAFADWVLSLHQRDLARLADVSFTRSGVMRAERVLDRVRELVGDQRVENLAVPFTAVATDLLAGREVWFQRGAVDVAIRASIALPGIFTPVTVNERLLVDGGLVEPLPVAAAAAVRADLTVAISLTGERDLSAVAPHETADPGPFDEWVSRFRRGAAQAFGAIGGPAAEKEDEVAGAEASESTPNELPVGLTGLEIIIYAYEAMQRVLNRYRLARFPPDVLITVPEDACRTLDFHRATSMVELGRKLTADALDAFEAERGHRRPRDRLDRHQSACAESAAARTAHHCALVGRLLVAEQPLRFVPRCKRVWRAHGDSWPQTRPTATGTVGSRIGSPVWFAGRSRRRR